MKGGDIERLRAWTEKKRKDPAYRSEMRRRANARAAQLKADAEYGRQCRAVMDGLVALLAMVKNSGKTLSESEVAG